MANDVRYALRSLARNRGFTITSFAVLALAIGASTAMFSIVNASLFRPLPFRSPDQLTMLWREHPGQGIREGRFAPGTIEDLRKNSTAFTGIAFFDPASVSLTGGAEAQQIGVIRLSPNLLDLLGVAPERGRMFTAREAEERQPLALIGHEFWQSYFGGSPDAIGATIVVDELPCRVIGILPASFRFSDAAIWQSHTLARDWERQRAARGTGSWFMIGRLATNVDVPQAQAEMTSLVRRLDQESSGLGITVVPLAEQIVGPGARLSLWLLAGAVALVLLIAITNVASLSLVRAAGRAKEFATRLALGANAGHIARQLLAETLILTGAAGIAGVLLASWTIRAVQAAHSIPGLNDAAMDGRALGWTFLVCGVTAVVLALAPGLTLSLRRGRIASTGGVRGSTTGAGTHRLRRALTVAQFALTVILVAGAGLLLRSLWSIGQVDAGFRTERVVSMQISLPASMSTARRVNLYREALAAIEAAPDVESAGIVSDFLIGGSPERDVTLEGDTRQISERVRFRSDEVSSEFFRAVGTPLLKGRFFSGADGLSPARVAILNLAMAERLWPGRDPLGKRFAIGTAQSPDDWFTVVGIVANMRRNGLEHAAVPQMFESIEQNPPRLGTILIRTRSEDPMRISGSVKAIFQGIEKNAAVYRIAALENQLGDLLAQRRFQARLLAGFATAALLLAAVGLYGLIQYIVTARTREIGIRMALGATAGGIFRMTVGDGVRMSLSGIALGLLGSLWMASAASNVLYGVTPSDPLALGGGSALLATVAAAACYLPARRAMRVDPAEALRRE